MIFVLKSARISLLRRFLFILKCYQIFNIIKQKTLKSVYIICKIYLFLQDLRKTN